PSVETANLRATTFSVASARDAAWRDSAVGRQDRAVHRLQEAQRAGRAVTRRERTLSAGTLSQPEVLDHHRKAHFENFRVGQARVGHVDVHARGAIEAAPIVHAAGRAARADGLVILVL